MNNPTPEELHDWHRDRHGLDRKRRPLARILYAALIACVGIWCAQQAYLTVDYVWQRTAAMEGGR